MVILVDTNILLDIIADREPYAEYGKKILEKCAKREIIGSIAAHSILNLFYILRKDFSQKERRECAGRAQEVRWTSVLRGPKRSVER